MYQQPTNKIDEETSKEHAFKINQAINNRENGVMFFTQTMKMAGDYYRTGKKRPKKLHVDEWTVLKKE